MAVKRKISQASAPTQTVYTSGSGTYTVPAGCQWLRVRMVGGGGGGGGSGGGSNGGSTIFDGTTCDGGVGGGGGASAVGGSSGGTVTAGTSCVFSMKGGNSTAANPNTTYSVLSIGGSTPLGTGGVSGSNTPAISSAAGGGYGFGGFGYIANGGYGGAAGGAGGYAELIVKNLSATYAYSVGAAGAGQLGGAYNGGVGVIIIEEYYS